jgi:hypothetical protein
MNDDMSICLVLFGDAVLVTFDVDLRKDYLWWSFVLFILLTVGLHRRNVGLLNAVVNMSQIIWAWVSF